MPQLDPDRVTTLTFDCYGTLIDWEAGAIQALRPLLARHGVTLSDDEIITVFQDLDAALCEPPYKPYRTVLAEVIEGFGQRFAFPVGRADRALLASSVPSWQPFPDTVEALRALASQYRLAVISNIDDDLFDASAHQLGVQFDQVVTAEQTRCYKPRTAIFEEALRRLAVELQTAHGHLRGDASPSGGGAEIGRPRRLGGNGNPARQATWLRDSLGPAERTVRPVAHRGSGSRSPRPADLAGEDAGQRLTDPIGRLPS